MSAKLSPDEIKRLWNDPDFEGHGLGLVAFKEELQSRFDVKLSDAYLRSVLMQIPDFIKNQLRRKKIDRRSYVVHGFGTLYQADLAVMPEFAGFRFIFFLIDCATLWLWSKVLKERKKETIRECFDEIFAKWPKCDRLEFDRAGEFIALTNDGYFQRNHIWVHFKKPPLKAPYIEGTIFHIKRKLYLAMRSQETRNWPELVDKIVHNWNFRSHKSLGNLKPAQLNSPEKSVLLDQYVNKKESTFEERRQNEKDYEQDGKIQVNSYVFISPNIKRHRGFHEQHGALYKVARIDSREKQPLFYLENLLGVPMEDAYYKEELKLYPSGPQPGYTFRVQSIIAEREVGGEREFLCSFQGYNRKMRTWVKKNDLVE